MDESTLDVLILTEIVNTNIKYNLIEEALPLSDSITPSIKYIILADNIAYSEIVNLAGTIHTQLGADTIVFNETLYPRVLLATATDIWFVYDESIGEFFNITEDEFGLSDVVSCVFSTALQFDSVAFTDITSTAIIVNPVINDALIISDAANCIQLRNGLTPTQVLAQTSGTTVTFTGTTTLTLPNPKFGDTDTVTYKRKNTTTRGGTPIIAAYDEWQPTKLFKIEWDYLSELEINTLRQFIKDNLGQPVTLVDHNNNIRTVIFQNPDKEFSTIGRFNRTFTADLYEL